MYDDLVKVLLPATLSFGVGIAITPFLTHYLYKYKAWKKQAGKGGGYGGGDTPLFNELHKEKEVGTPRMGGIIIWASVAFVALGGWLVAQVFPGTVTEKLVFLSRDQTWLPLFALVVGAFVGLFDDVLEVMGNGNYFAGGLSLRWRLLVVSVVAFIAAWWFFDKLDVSSIGIPFLGDIELGLLFVPFFVLVTISVYAGGVIDGVDGLSGGVFAAIFTAYAVIAFEQSQINIAAFCATLIGGILAFLWFNIPPARFYMSETGIMGLTIVLAIIAFMTDSLGEGYGVAVLPIVAMPLTVTVLSDIVQVLSKKFRGKKVFLIAPLHHHFEALGWPAPKVTMRYWILSIIFAFIGVIIAIIG
jgi:phospho-N-acetylmuramoyl-pentapeptide-transferase